VLPVIECSQSSSIAGGQILRKEEGKIAMACDKQKDTTRTIYCEIMNRQETKESTKHLQSAALHLLRSFSIHFSSPPSPLLPPSRPSLAERLSRAGSGGTSFLFWLSWNRFLSFVRARFQVAPPPMYHTRPTVLHASPLSGALPFRPPMDAYKIANGEPTAYHSF